MIAQAMKQQVPNLQNMDLIDFHKVLLNDFLKEIEAMTQLNHKNILKVVGVSINKDFLIVTELCRKNLMNQFLNNQTEHWKIIKYTSDLAEAFAWIHEHDMAQRDLKPDNILIGFNGVMSLGDFGLAAKVQLGANLTTACISAPF